MSTPEPSGRFGRWAIKIQCGAFKIIYRKVNQVADALSRAPLSAEDIPADDHVKEKEVTQYWPNWDGNKSSLLPIDKIGKDNIHLCKCEVKLRDAEIWGIDHLSKWSIVRKTQKSDRYICPNDF
uniref:Uncharacterized protein n=1 Tax=Strigamia maritima TaxID=126957 RepID=T1JIZ2_STRMM